MANSVSVTGFKELDDNLKQLIKLSTQKAVLRRSMKKAAQPIADDAASRAPQGTTGKLKKSITVSNKLTKSQKRSQKSASDKSSVQMYVGSSDRKAHLVELGTAPHINKGKFAGSEHPGTSPQPFLRPAWEAGKEQFMEVLKEEMGSAIAKSLKAQTRRLARGS